VATAQISPQHAGLDTRLFTIAIFHVSSLESFLRISFLSNMREDLMMILQKTVQGSFASSFLNR
jgi:hypothetical protein